MSKSYRLIDVIQGDIITYMEEYTELHPRDVYNITTSLCEIVAHRVNEVVVLAEIDRKIQDELETLGD